MNSLEHEIKKGINCPPVIYAKRTCLYIYEIFPKKYKTVEIS